MISFGQVLNDTDYRNICYAGDCSHTVQKEKVYRNVSGIIDKISVTWKGRGDEPFTPPYMWRGLELTSYEVDEQGPWTEISATYGGDTAATESGSAADKLQIGKVFIDCSTSIGSSSKSCSSPEQASREVTYVQPVTVKRYKSLSPVYSGGVGLANASAFRILKSVIIDAEGKRYPGNAPAALVAALQMFAGTHVTVNCTGQEQNGVEYYDVQETASLIYE